MLDVKLLFKYWNIREQYINFGEGVDIDICYYLYEKWKYCTYKTWGKHQIK